MKKLFTILMLSLFFGFTSQAQLKIGLPAGAPNAGAILDLSNTGGNNKGFLPPLVTLSANNTWALNGTATNGMMVFNTATAGSGATAVFVGPYYWYNSQWNQVSTQSGTAPATFTGGTLSCTGAQSGTYQVGVAMTSANTKAVSITVATTGSYTATTTTNNGISFAASGNALSNGNNSFPLTASGTPIAGGTFAYALSFGGQNCNFNITFAGTATFACGTATQNQSPGGALVNGTSYTGGYSIPYTAGNGTSYSSSTETVNGLTLTRAAGTYLAGGGSVAYTLTGNAGTAATAVFTIPECTTVTFGDAILGSLSTSKAAYIAANVDDYVQVTQAEYDNLTTTIAGITNYGMKIADRSITTPGATGWTMSMPLNDIPTTAIPFAFSTKLDANPGCVLLISQPSNVTGGPGETPWSSAVGISIPASTVNRTVYIVIKRPTKYMPVNTCIAVHGFYYGYGALSGGSGLDHATSSNTSGYPSAGNAEKDCTMSSSAVTVNPTAGTFPAAAFFNYDIKYTTNKQW